MSHRAVHDFRQNRDKNALIIKAMLDGRQSPSPKMLRILEERNRWYEQILDPFDRGERLPTIAELSAWPNERF
jgi:hypothetical protein